MSKWAGKCYINECANQCISRLERLPNEILIKICNYLNARDQSRLAVANKRLNIRIISCDTCMRIPCDKLGWYQYVRDYTKLPVGQCCSVQWYAKRVDSYTRSVLTLHPYTADFSPHCFLHSKRQVEAKTCSSDIHTDLVMQLEMEFFYGGCIYCDDIDI